MSQVRPQLPLEAQPGPAHPPGVRHRASIPVPLLRPQVGSKRHSHETCRKETSWCHDQIIIAFKRGELFWSFFYVSNLGLPRLGLFTTRQLDNEAFKAGASLTARQPHYTTKMSNLARIYPEWKTSAWLCVVWLPWRIPVFQLWNVSWATRFTEVSHRVSIFNKSTIIFVGNLVAYLLFSISDDIFGVVKVFVNPPLPCDAVRKQKKTEKRSFQLSIFTIKKCLPFGNLKPKNLGIFKA